LAATTNAEISPILAQVLEPLVQVEVPLTFDFEQANAWISV